MSKNANQSQNNTRRIYIRSQRRWQEVPEETLIEAAIIAAYHSRARQSSGVPVDYTQVRNLKKPQGAKPGKVIYHVYNTLYVTPNRDLVNKLAK